MRLHKFWYIILLFLLNCQSPLQQQAKFLLPENYKIHLDQKKEIGITKYFIYKVDKQIVLADIYNFPIQVSSIKDRNLVKWHSPTSNEIKQIEEFISIEQNNSFAESIIPIDLNEIMIAFFYDQKQFPLGDSKYSIYNWMDLYLLDIKRNAIILISYGDF